MNALDEIENQNLARKILEGILKSGRIANTYLFIGPEGTGKKFSAIQFAKALNCEKGGCEECSSCIKIGELSHPDLHIITPDSDKYSILVDQIRNVQKEAYLKPFIAKFKVYIIEEAGKLTEEAANSLLKVLEEPPRDTVFILTTSSPQEILPTIISRCQIVRFVKNSKNEVKNLEVKEEVLSLMETNEISDILKEVKNIIGTKEESIDIIDFLALWYRDILLLKEKEKDSITFKDRVNQLKDIEKKLSIDSLISILREILWARYLLTANLSPRLTFEALFLRCQELGSDPNSPTGERQWLKL